MFLIDKSGSMEGAIEQSKEALSRILAGFPLREAAHRDLRHRRHGAQAQGAQPRGRAAHAGGHQGGRRHHARCRRCARCTARGVRVPATSKLVVIVVGDEAGEAGDQFARAFRECGYEVAAMALLVSVAGRARGNTVRSCARALQVPFSEVSVDSFEDPYQVPRVLKALLDAPLAGTGGRGLSADGWVEQVMKTPLLEVSHAGAMSQGNKRVGT